MRAFIDGCRTIAAAGIMIAVGVLVTALAGSAPARADSTFEFKGSGSPSASGRQVSRSKRMRLGATAPQRKRENLSGGVPQAVERRAIRTTRVHRHTQRRARVRTASLGTSHTPAPSFGQNLAGGGIQWQANSGCLNASLRAVIAQVASTFGPVRVSSTCRSRRHNSRVGGAHRSHHLSGNAVDFRVLGGSVRAVYSFLRSHASVGGLKLYRRGFFHIDTGSRRSW